MNRHHKTTDPAENEAPLRHPIGTYNEWGTLNDVIVGIYDQFIEPEYIPEFRWMSEESQNITKTMGGEISTDVLPEKMRLLSEKIEAYVALLKKQGITVRRNVPLQYPEEQDYLNNIQKGTIYSGGADFFRIIGKHVILLNNLRFPFRRKQVWTVRPVLEPLLRGQDVRYVSLPPVSPHYTPNDLYLENGDIMLDGRNVYVGISGNATSETGLAWLAQYLGPEYHIYKIPLTNNILHLDTVLTLNRPGLLTYYPDFVKELPKPLQDWDKIKVYPEAGEECHFGANNISLDENTIVLSTEYKRMAPEFETRGFEVLMTPMGASIEYGSGSRCLTAILSRDP